ncbi:MAG: nitroreductase family protein [Chloroflexota bacterium]|nr:nitroreductase family protein [Chloroflexota bacterium]
MLRDLIRKNRSYRRFDQQVKIAEATLRELVELARLSASGANRQPLKFVLSATAAQNARIFPCLHWAGYLRDWDGPAAGERPTAYIVILGDTEINESCGVDHGIAAQSIMLGATERGLGGCILGAVEREALREVLALPARYEILLVLALGKPVEEVVIESVPESGDIKYWRDEAGVHHVPKQSLAELILSDVESL